MCSSQTQAASLNTTAMAKTARNREKGDSGRCKKQRSMQLYSRQRRNPNKGKTLAPKLVAQSEVSVGQPAMPAESEQPVPVLQKQYSQLLMLLPQEVILCLK